MVTLRRLVYAATLALAVSAYAVAQTPTSGIPPHIHIRVLDKNMNIWLPLGNKSPLAPEISGRLNFELCGSGTSSRYTVAGTGRIVHGRNIIEITGSDVTINGLLFAGLNVVAEPDGKVVPNAFIRTFQ